MDCIELISNLSPRLERSVDGLVEVESVAAELGRTTRGKTFAVRGRIHWAGLLAAHRVLYDDAFFLLEALSEALETHHHAAWASWRQGVFNRAVVLESLLPEGAEDDGDKNRFHRRWKSDRVDGVRLSVLKRMFGEGETPVPLRLRVEELAGRLHLQRGGRAASHTFTPGSPRHLGDASYLSTGAVRVALGFLSSTFNDISVLSDGVVRTYPGPSNREVLEHEARTLTDAILLGDADHLQKARYAVAHLQTTGETAWNKLRELFYQRLHSAHDAGIESGAFVFNDIDVEMRVLLQRTRTSLPPPSR